MSHHIALRKLRGHIYGQIAANQAVDEWTSQKYWYALRDAGGKIRDWIPASVAKEARMYFAVTRGHRLMPGYRVERRGRTNHYREGKHLILICEPATEIEREE